MRVVRNTPERLELRGTPGGLTAAVAMTLVGLALSAGAGWFAALEHRANGGLAWSHAPLALGLAVGQTMFCTGTVTLAIGRVALTLDRASGRGWYDVYSPIVRAGRPCRFTLGAIAGLEIRTTEERQHNDNDGPAMPSTVHRLRLLVRKPRAAVVLAECENTAPAPLEELGAVVAEWLGVDPPHAEEPGVGRRV